MGIERTPAVTSAADAAGSPDERADGPPVHRHRHRPPLTAALVAGAVLVAGGGGAYWAASAAAGGARASHGSQDTGPGTSGKAGGPPPLALNGWTGTDTPSDPGGSAYRATGALPAGPGSAHVYRAVDQVPRADVARLAAALGVRGPVRLDGGIWRAGAAPGARGPALEVSQDAPGSWVFSRYGTTPPCRPRTALPPSGTAVCYSAADSTMASGPAGTASPASPQQAMRAAAPVLAALGLTGQPTDTSQTAGSDRTIVVDPVFDGLPTHGWRTSLQVASDGGLLSATGRLARLAQGPAYPVVSAERALQEMQAPGSSRVPAACPTSHPGSATGTTGTTGAGGVNPGGPMLRPSASASDPSNPVDRQRPAMGPCVPGWAAQPLEVRGATFGLSAQFVSGRPELVPSWLFRVARSGDGQAYTVAQPAVDPRFLTAPGGAGAGDPSAPSPSPSPSGSPSGVATATPTRVDSYSATGRTLTLHFYGGLCDTYSASVVRQSTGSVAVRVTGMRKNPRQICPMIAKQFTERVTLAQTLDARPVYDASDGHTVVEHS
ncbi:hypothetical protein NGB36_13525 [Streptomyces sp. RB6PN25]|uniref:Large membrane protein n=1 Tax=Streptomyces humicola TaxID=2953240 RepID=A0ABT1PV97_9ACTN|nr:hypothetical protein [Streptomyces humicola]MCQ4081598.1 hypothetical protein [Streptomyces humicola]